MPSLWVMFRIQIAFNKNKVYFLIYQIKKYILIFFKCKIVKFVFFYLSNTHKEKEYVVFGKYLIIVISWCDYRDFNSIKSNFFGKTFSWIQWNPRFLILILILIFFLLVCRYREIEELWWLLIDKTFIRFWSIYFHC